MQRGQEGLEEPPSFKLSFNLQYRAGPHTAKADTTANTTRQHRKHAVDRLDISLFVTCVSLSLSLSVCLCVCVRK